MRKSKAFIDLDKTLLESHSFFDIAKQQVDEGIFAHSAFLDLMIEYDNYKKGQGYSVTAQRLLEIYSLALKGRTSKLLEDSARKFFELNKHRFFNYVWEFIPFLKKTHDVVLVTTNVQYAAKAVVKLLNLDDYISTQIEKSDGVITGRLANTLASGKSVINDYVDAHDAKSLAIGDSPNDVDMFNAVKFPVCFEPDAELTKIAEGKKWTVVTRDTILPVVTALLK